MTVLLETEVVLDVPPLQLEVNVSDVSQLELMEIHAANSAKSLVLRTVNVQMVHWALEDVCAAIQDGVALNVIEDLVE